MMEQVRAVDVRSTGRTNSGAAAGTWGFALAVGYAVFVRFYQSAGGRIGLSGDPGPDAQWASYVAGLVVLVGGVACLVLTRRTLRTVPRRVPVLGGIEAPRALMVVVCMVPTVLGGLIGIAHGVSGLAKLGELAGLGTASITVGGPPPSTSDVLWDLLFYNPWFAAMGACLLLSALGYARASRMSERAIRMIGRSIVAACVVVSVVWLLAVILHWNLNTDLLF